MTPHELPLCWAHLLCVLELPGPHVPRYVWQRLGIDTMVILRALSPTRYESGAALGVQLALPGMCVWCQGPEPSDSFVQDEEEWAEPTP